MSVLLQGAMVGGGLIVAIGAQNTYVLSQGIKKQYHFLVPLICSVSDTLLIFAGATGVGTLVAKNQLLQNLALWGGALFLFIYGAMSLKGVFSDKKMEMESCKNQGLKVVLITTLAFTFLNPHVYLDTVVLIGSIAGQYETNDRILFAVGASVASFAWFYSLSFGGKVLSPLFKNSSAWKMLDLVVCLTMWFIAIQLLQLKL